MIDNRRMDIVQPDLDCRGGFVRAAWVARMARQAGITIAPHDTQTGAEGWRRPNPIIENGAVKVPTGPGLGLEIGPEYPKKAEIVKRS
jgi:L-alanine-DL-glutamate epimerase-like enolase superfamily enzyme